MNTVASRNIKFVSHSDQGGRGDGVQIMVHRGYAYIGHAFSNGITVLDVRDPKHPKSVNFLPCSPNTRALHLQVHDDLLLAVNCPSMWTMQISERAYFGGSAADILNEQKAQYTSGMPTGGAARSLIHADRWSWTAPHLVCGWALCVRVDPFLRFQRPYSCDRRHV